MSIPNAYMGPHPPPTMTGPGWLRHVPYHSCVTRITLSFSCLLLYTCVHELGLDSAGQCTVPLFKSSLTLIKISSLRTKIENITGH